MPKRTHATMKEAQAACKKLRLKARDHRSTRADEIEAEWHDHPDYQPDYLTIVDYQSGRYAPR